MTRIDRRSFLGAGALAAAGLTSCGSFGPRGAFAQLLAETPSVGEGPFFPDELPRDTDNDLLILNDGITPAVGTITHVSGRVLSQAGEPLRNALVELWQADSRGSYLHSDGASDEGRDANFQGYGRFLTGSRGEYCFRTIHPVPYRGRAPHLHVAVSHGGKRQLTTQLGVAGYAGNDRDGVFRGLDAGARARLMVAYAPVPGSKLGELAGQHDLVLGYTPEERPDGSMAAVDRRAR